MKTNTLHAGLSLAPYLTADPTICVEHDIGLAEATPVVLGGVPQPGLVIVP